MRLATTLDFIERCHIDNGCTWWVEHQCTIDQEYHPHGRYVASHDGGWVVGGLSELNVTAFLDDVWRPQTHLRGLTYVGSWFDCGKWYLDLSAPFETEAEAIDFAVENRQLSIFDLHLGRVIYV